MEGLEVGPEVGPEVGLGIGPGVVSLLRTTGVLFPSFFVPQGSVCFLLCVSNLALSFPPFFGC